MGDPLSIASGALAVITAAQMTTSAIYKFIRDCREARTDLTQVRGELSELTLILELIRDDNAAATEGCLPSTLQVQVHAMLSSCTTTVQQIENALAKCRGKSGPLRWTIVEKDKVTSLKGSLEAFKSGLSLALETINLSITREINNKTEVIQDNTLDIKRDTSQILDEIYKLRNQLPPSYPTSQDRFHLEQWLDSLTHYAETVVAQEEPTELSDAASFIDDVEQQHSSDNETSLSKNAEEQKALDNQLSANNTSDVEPVETLDVETSIHHDGTPLPSRNDHTQSEHQSGIPDLSKPKPPETQTSPAGRQSQGKHGPNEIPCHIVASLPCRSKVMWVAYCMKLDVWATLQEDLTLKIWSPHKAKLIVSLPVLRKDSGKPGIDITQPDSGSIWLRFCPEKPKFILIQPCPQKLEIWNWSEKRRIRITSDVETALTKDSVMCPRFIPQTTLIYAYDKKGCITIVDIDEPLISRKISLDKLTRRAQRDGNKCIRATFVSSCEIVSIWKRPSPSTGCDSNRGTESKKLFVLLSLLPQTRLKRQRVSVKTRYSDTIIESAQVKAKYHLQRHIQSVFSSNVDQETRRLILTAGCSEEPKRGEKQHRNLYVLDLDTGLQLFEFPLKGKRWKKLSSSSSYIVCYNKGSYLGTVISVEDGCELGTIRGRCCCVANSGKLAFRRTTGSGTIEFGETDASLEELSNPYYRNNKIDLSSGKR